MKLIPKAYSEIDELRQKQLYAAAIDLWNKTNKELDTLTASVRFEIPPTKTGAIINYALASMRYQTYKPSLKDPFPNKKKDHEKFIQFVQKYHKENSCWLMPPIMQAGFLPTFKFLSVFGGRMYLLDQFKDLEPYSVATLVYDILEAEAYASFQRMLDAGKKMSRICIPTLAEFLLCFPPGVIKRG